MGPLLILLTIMSPDKISELASNHILLVARITKLEVTDKRLIVILNTCPVGPSPEGSSTSNVKVSDVVWLPLCS